MNTGLAPELIVDGHVATITLRRPAQANRLEVEDLHRLLDHFARVNAAPEILVLRLAATGRSFCSGFNIGSVGAEGVDAGALFAAVADGIEALRPVTIAAIQGGVYGGATDLALACDFRVGVAGMELRMPAAHLGLHYYASGLRRYVSRLGLPAAKRLFLLAETLGGEELLRLGYLDALAADLPALDAQVQALAASLRAGAPLALRGMKLSLDEIARGEFDPARVREREAACAASADLQEGLAAFAARRLPQFKGR